MMNWKENEKNQLEEVSDKPSRINYIFRKSSPLTLKVQKVVLVQ